MNSEFSRKAWYLPLGVVFGWFALSLLLKPLYAPLEDRLVDARFRLRGEQAIDSSIVVLYMDNDQVASLGGWPIRRSYYALMVDVLHRLGASIVATDIFFQSRVPEYPEYDDLPMLVQAFVEREGLSLRISANVMEAFLNHEWRGNVRELESMIKRTAVLAKAEEDRALQDRVRKKILEYLVNAVDPVDRSKSVEEMKRAAAPKYKNLPQRYHLFLSEILETYHRGEWDLPKEG